MFKQEEHLLPTVKCVDGSASPNELLEQWFKVNHFYITQKTLVQQYIKGASALDYFLSVKVW